MVDTFLKIDFTKRGKVKIPPKMKICIGVTKKINSKEVIDKIASYINISPERISLFYQGYWLPKNEPIDLLDYLENFEVEIDAEYQIRDPITEEPQTSHKALEEKLADLKKMTKSFRKELERDFPKNEYSSRVALFLKSMRTIINGGVAEDMSTNGSACGEVKNGGKRAHEDQEDNTIEDQQVALPVLKKKKQTEDLTPLTKKNRKKRVRRKRRESHTLPPIDFSKVNLNSKNFSPLKDPDNEPMTVSPPMSPDPTNHHTPETMLSSTSVADCLRNEDIDPSLVSSKNKENQNSDSCNNVPSIRLDFHPQPTNDKVPETPVDKKLFPSPQDKPVRDVKTKVFCCIIPPEAPTDEPSDTTPLPSSTAPSSTANNQTARPKKRKSKLSKSFSLGAFLSQAKEDPSFVLSSTPEGSNLLPPTIKSTLARSFPPRISPLQISTPKHRKFEDTFSQYQRLLNYPGVGDQIAFKTIELSADYCPQISDYKTAKVVSTDCEQYTFEVEILSEEKPKRNRKFELAFDTEEEADVNKQVPVLRTYKWSDFLEPKLICANLN